MSESNSVYSQESNGDGDHEDKEEKKPQFTQEEIIKQKNSKVKKIFENERQVNGVTLDLHASYGAQYRNIRNQMVVVKDIYVIFMAGSCIVALKSDDKSQRFFHKKDMLRNVTAIDANMSAKDKKLIIAVGESPDSIQDKFPPVVYIIQQEKKKWIKLIHSNIEHRGTIENIQLLTEKYICLVTINRFKPKLPCIYLWSYTTDTFKDKVIACCPIKTIFNRVCINPVNTKQIIMMGESYLKIWEAHLQEKIFKETQIQLVPLKIERESDFIDYCWIGSKGRYLIILLTADNKIIMLQNGELQGPPIEIDPNTINYNKTKDEAKKEDDEFEGFFGYNKMIEEIMKEKTEQSEKLKKEKEEKQKQDDGEGQVLFKCICSTKKGFVIGGTQGRISYFDLENNLRIKNDQTKNFIIDKTGGSTVVNINTVENLATVTTLKKKKLDFYLLRPHFVESDKQAIQPLFDNGFHNQTITGITASRCKSIFATCGRDKFIKIYNYNYLEGENDTSKIMEHEFKNIPLDISLHPYGLFIAVTFQTGFRVFSLVHDQLIHLNEVNLPECRVARYSHGGHYIVSNEKSIIFVFDSIYYETLYKLTGHSAIIRDISISEDDRHLVSTCNSGICYLWDLSNEKTHDKRRETFIHKGENPYSQIVYDKEFDLFIGCGPKNCLSVYDEKLINVVMNCRASDWTYTCIALCKFHKVCFFGTNTGSIIMHLWPIDESQCILEKIPNTHNYQMQFPSFTHITSHNCSINKLLVTPDNQYLISAGVDGSMFQFKINELILGTEQSETQQKNKAKDKDQHIFAYTEMFLERQTQIKEKNERIQTLEFKNIKAQQINAQEIDKFENQQLILLQEEKEECDRILEQDKKTYAELIKETNEDENRLVDKLNEQQLKYDKEIKEMKITNNSKVQYEQEQNEELRVNIKDQKESQEQQLKTLFNQHRKDILFIKQKYKDKCTRLQVKYSVIVEKAQQRGQQKLTRLDKQEEEHEREIEDSVRKTKSQIEKEKTDNEEQKKVNESHRTLNNKLQQQNVDLQNECLEQLGENSELKETAIRNSADLIKMHEQLLEREQVILSKEETCKQARDESLNLENFWYMLDQRIKEQVKRKEYLSEKIKFKEKKLKNMFSELIREANRNDALHQIFRKQQDKIRVQENFIKKFVSEIKFWRGRLIKIENMLVRMMETPPKIEIWAKKISNVIEISVKIGLDLAKQLEFQDDDITNMIKNKTGEHDSLNKELFKQTNWLQKKINLINLTNNKLKEIREDNIETIMNHNTKLLEECNMLRGENEVLRMHMNSLEKVIREAEKKKAKLTQKKIPDRIRKSITSLQGILNEYEQNQTNLQQQNQILQSIDGKMQNYEEQFGIDDKDSKTKFPAI